LRKPRSGPAGQKAHFRPEWRDNRASHAQSSGLADRPRGAPSWQFQTGWGRNRSLERRKSASATRMQSRRRSSPAEVAALVCALLVISAQKSRSAIMPVCVHLGLGRQCPEVRNGLRRWYCVSSRWRSWSPDAACGEAATSADRVDLVARHPSRLIARLRLRRLSSL
jgi:hypothetical protein